MIDIKVSLKNDECGFYKWFKNESVYLGKDSHETREMIEETKRMFNQPVDQVDVKINMKDI